MFVERVDDNSVSEIEGQGNSFQKCLDDNSTMEHDTHAQVDVSSFGPSSTKRKKLRKDRSKRRKLSDSEVSSLGSTQEGASPPAQDVRDCSVRDTSSNHLDEATASGYAGKMVEEVVAGHGTSFLVAGDILLEKASAECPDGESASGEQDEKIKMENSEEMMINGQSVAKDDAVLDVRPTEEFRDKPTTISLEEKTSDDTRGSDPSVENRESDNLGAEPMLKDTIPSASQLGAMTDDVIGKEGPRQMLQSSLEGTPPGNFRKKLIVLDVNGLLADIIPCVPGGFKYNPDTIISNKAIFKRPYCDDFLQFCFERFHVGVWSSRTKKNVDSVLDFLMGKSKCNLLFCWDQSHCTITGFNTVENRDKPLLLKELRKLWEKHEPDLPWERGEYNESNTLLLDDSPYKALRNPPHTAIFPYTYQYKNVRDNSLGPAGDLRVYLEGLAFADNVQKYVQLNPFGQRPITETNLSWAFYLKVIGTTSSPREENANDSSACLP